MIGEPKALVHIETSQAQFSLQVLGTVDLFLSILSRFIVFVYLFYWLEIQEVYVLAFSSLLGLQINAEVEPDD